MLAELAWPLQSCCHCVRLFIWEWVLFEDQSQQRPLCMLAHSLRTGACSQTYAEFPCWGQHIVCDATATEFTPSLVSVCEYVWVCVKENARSCVHPIVPSILGDLILWLVKSHPHYCGTGHQHSSLENLKGFENEERPAGWASVGSSDPMSSYSHW